jgi:hypothetical protein
VRTGSTSTPDGTWTPFNPVANSGDPISGTSQYAQYRAVLSTSDPDVTPVLEDVTLTYVVDDVAPIASCQDITISFDANGNATITADQVDNGSSDNFGIVSLSVAPNTFGPLNLGANTVTLTVTDTSGNQSSCPATVTVEDITPPTALCQNITVQLDEAGSATITAANIDNGSTDAVGIASLSVATDTFADIGNYPVTLTVTDTSDNESTCTATVTVKDNFAPTITCPADITVDAAPGADSAVVNYDDPTVSDNAPGVTFALTGGLASGSAFPVGTTAVSFTATDAAGNTASCSFDVTVNETEFPGPTAVCKDVTVQLDENGLASITPADVDGGSTGDNQPLTLSVTPDTFTDIGDYLQLLVSDR